jgi:hypothetical protein
VITIYQEVEVEIDADAVIADADDEDIKDLIDAAVRKGKLTSVFGYGYGEGDAAHAENIIERAYLAAKAMPNLPRDIADLFWHVHGRAL